MSTGSMPRDFLIHTSSFFGENARDLKKCPSQLPSIEILARTKSLNWSVLVLAVSAVSYYRESDARPILAHQY